MGTRAIKVTRKYSKVAYHLCSLVHCTHKRPCRSTRSLGRTEILYNKGTSKCFCLYRTLLLKSAVASALAYILRLRHTVWSSDCVNHYFITKKQYTTTTVLQYGHVTTKIRHSHIRQFHWVILYFTHVAQHVALPKAPFSEAENLLTTPDRWRPTASAVAAQLWAPPKMLTGAPLMVISKDKISTLWHISRPFTTKYPKFFLFLNSQFFSSTCTQFQQNRRQKVFNRGASCLCRRNGHYKNLHFIHNAEFANCANHYKIIKYFPRKYL